MVSSDASHSSDADDVEAATRSELRALLGDTPGIELRPMFGTLAALVDGHVFAVALDDVIGVKLDADALADLEALPGSEILTMGTRPMKAYRSLPAEMSAAERRVWLTRARDHVASQHS
ncbi:MAG: TfoX/Sxy family protein [Terrabacter sp.]|nr:TfoX/Sxy family protein [Terrabacter sp.]